MRVGARGRAAPGLSPELCEVEGEAQLPSASDAALLSPPFAPPCVAGVKGEGVGGSGGGGDRDLERRVLTECSQRGGGLLLATLTDGAPFRTGLPLGGQALQGAEMEKGGQRVPRSHCKGSKALLQRPLLSPDTPGLLALSCPTATSALSGKQQQGESTENRPGMELEMIFIFTSWEYEATIRGEFQGTGSKGPFCKSGFLGRAGGSPKAQPRARNGTQHAQKVGQMVFLPHISQKPKTISSYGHFSPSGSITDGHRNRSPLLLLLEIQPQLWLRSSGSLFPPEGVWRPHGTSHWASLRVAEHRQLPGFCFLVLDSVHHRGKATPPSKVQNYSPGTTLGYGAVAPCHH